MKTKNKVIMIIVILLAVITVVTVVVYKNNEEVTQSENQDGFIADDEDDYDDDFLDEDDNVYGELVYMQNHSRYVVVKNILSEIYSYINSDNNLVLLSTMNSNYIDYYGINENNIANYIAFKDGIYLSNILKIKETSLNENITAYFINVLAVQDEINTDYALLEKQNEYFVIFIDESNSTYSYMPIDEETFNLENVTYEYEYSIEEIKQNDYNNFSGVSVSNENIVEIYFSNLRFLYLIDNEKFSELIISGSTEDIYMDLTSQISTYIYDFSSGYIEIEDIYGFVYSFYIDAVLDYTVKIS